MSILSTSTRSSVSVIGEALAYPANRTLSHSTSFNSGVPLIAIPPAAHLRSSSIQSQNSHSYPPSPQLLSSPTTTIHHFMLSPINTIQTPLIPGVSTFILLNLPFPEHPVSTRMAFESPKTGPSIIHEIWRQDEAYTIYSCDRLGGGESFLLAVQTHWTNHPKPMGKWGENIINFLKLYLFCTLS